MLFRVRCREEGSPSVSIVHDIIVKMYTCKDDMEGINLLLKSGYVDVAQYENVYPILAFKTNKNQTFSRLH